MRTTTSSSKSGRGQPTSATTLERDNWGSTDSGSEEDHDVSSSSTSNDGRGENATTSSDGAVTVAERQRRGMASAITGEDAEVQAQEIGGQDGHDGQDKGGAAASPPPPPPPPQPATAEGHNEKGEEETSSSSASSSGWKDSSAAHNGLLAEPNITTTLSVRDANRTRSNCWQLQSASSSRSTVLPLLLGSSTHHTTSIQSSRWSRSSSSSSSSDSSCSSSSGDGGNTPQQQPSVEKDFVEAQEPYASTPRPTTTETAVNEAAAAAAAAAAEPAVKKATTKEGSRVLSFLPPKQKPTDNAGGACAGGANNNNNSNSSGGGSIPTKKKPNPKTIIPYTFTPPPASLGIATASSEQPSTTPARASASSVEAMKQAEDLLLVQVGLPQEATTSLGSATLIEIGNNATGNSPRNSSSAIATSSSMVAQQHQQQQPGAYSATTSEEPMVRSTPVRYSALGRSSTISDEERQELDNYFASAASTSQEEEGDENDGNQQQQEEEPEATYTTSASTTTRRPGLRNGGLGDNLSIGGDSSGHEGDGDLLVVANPIGGSSGDLMLLPQGEEISSSYTNRQHQKKKERRYKRRYILLGGAFLGIVVAVVLLGIFVIPWLNSSNNGDGDDAPLDDGVVEPALSGGETTQATLIPFTTTSNISFEKRMQLLLPDYTLRSISNNPDSPQSIAYNWVLEDPDREQYANWRIKQRFALAVFYHTLDGDNWFDNTNWLEYGKHECDYYHSHVPWELAHAATGAKMMEEIWDSKPCGGSINDDDEDGAVDGIDSSEEYQFLYLYLNNLRGTIPRELFWLTSLNAINLFSNPITGTIPRYWEELAPNLTALVFAINEMHGPLPRELGLLTNLRGIALIGNGFIGTIPDELLSIGTLEELFLSDTKLTGGIPSTIGLMTNAVMIVITGIVSLTGKIPSELGLLTGLQDFHAEYSFLTGAIPSQVGNIVNLTVFDANTNYLSGPIPSEISNLSSLTLLDLSMNDLSGSIPRGFASLPASSYWLDLSGNPNLSGTVPNELCGSFLTYNCTESLCGCHCDCSA